LKQRHFAWDLLRYFYGNIYGYLKYEWIQSEMILLLNYILPAWVEQQIALVANALYKFKYVVEIFQDRRSTMRFLRLLFLLRMNLYVS